MDHTEIKETSIAKYNLFMFLFTRHFHINRKNHSLRFVCIFRMLGQEWLLAKSHSATWTFVPLQTIVMFGFVKASQFLRILFRWQLQHWFWLLRRFATSRPVQVSLELKVALKKMLADVASCLLFDVFHVSFVLVILKKVLSRKENYYLQSLAYLELLWLGGQWIQGCDFNLAFLAWTILAFIWKGRHNIYCHLLDSDFEHNMNIFNVSCQLIFVFKRFLAKFTLENTIDFDTMLHSRDGSGFSPKPEKPGPY